MLKNRSIGVLFGAFLVLAPLFAAAKTDDYSDYSFARLNYVRGEVSVQRASDLGTEKAEVNLPLVVGDKLLTMDGQAEVQFGRRNYLRIDSSAQVEFAVLPSETSGRINVHLLEGRAYLRVSSLGEEKGIEVHSPDASFYILEEGLYRFEVDAGNETQIFVHQGSAEAAGEKGSVVVRAMEKLSAARGVLLSGPESFYARSDGFDQWNESRDDLLARRSASAYLPSDISEYEEELGDNGRWVYEQPYGNVWVPYTHYVDWRPYYFGRWVWYPIIGWTWISSEPWGWCTSHYGRWHWGINLGWYWIPRIHWGPAWVSWYSDNDYVGWCPLSYYNRPVVIVDNHFYDSYRDPYYPINSRALTMVRRDQLQSPAISRHALAASQLSALGRINLRAEQPAVRPVIASSALRSPGSVRVPNSSGSPVIRSYGSNSSLANRGALSGPSLRSPSPRSSSGVSSGASPGSVRSPLSGSTVRTYPSSSSYDRIRTTPSSSPRSTYGTGTAIRSGETSGAGNGYPSRIRNDETRQSTVKEYSSSRSHPSRDSGPSYSPSTGRSYSAPSPSYSSGGSYSSPYRSSSYGSTYSAPSRSTPSGSYSSSRSYSAPRISGSYSSRNSGPSYSPSTGRSYSASSPSYSYGGSYSSPYRSSSYGSTYSAPSRSYSAPSHSSSSSRTSSSSSKSSSSHSSSSRSSSSSSSSRSGSIRKK